ncbi:MAG: polysaccharide pyruvyl transferase CsaB [Defluviitaleaceae bacterium]|nr:polysaccharide pyruvyl transferase CsaB [Defluviitaleaceae bacterium]
MHKVLMTLMGLEIGGAETHVLELSKTLKQMGVDVHVVSNGGVYEKELEACGIKHYQVPLHNKQLINVFSSYRALKKIILENDIKLVHAHARIPAFICGMLQKRLKFKLVTSAHYTFSVAFPFNKLSNWGDRVLSVSQDIKDYLLKNYKVDEKNISITVNGIDTIKFSPSLGGQSHVNALPLDENMGANFSVGANLAPTEMGATQELLAELKLDPSTCKIVSVSRLDTENSLPVYILIEIAKNLPSDIDIIIVGGGEESNTIEKKVNEANAAAGRKFIHMVGRRTDIVKFMQFADIFVGVSRAAMEAMSAETPVILAGHQGYLGIFEESLLPVAQENNFTCRGHEITTKDMLQRDLSQLLSLPKAELAALGKYNRQIIINHYSLERMAKDALSVYDDVLADAKNIVISGYYGNNNSGDDNLLDSIIQNLRALRPGLKITVLSLKPKETRAEFGVDAVYRFNLPAVFFALRKADLLVSGGGNLIQDETSTRSLIYYLWVINTAHFLGVKNMIYANGIGPVNRRSNYGRVRRSLNKVDLITLRESGSLEVLKEIGVTRPKTVVTADAVFALPPVAAGADILKNFGIHGKFFCVALRPWAQNPPELEAKIAKTCDYLIEKHGYQAVFVPMQPEKDSKIARQVISLMKNDAILLTPAPNDYNLGRSVLGLASFAICMRLHGLIHAMEKGVPAIGLVYSSKIREFMESMDQPWHMPVEEIDADRLMAFSDEIHENMDKVSAQIFEASNKLKALAGRNAELCVELLEG